MGDSILDPGSTITCMDMGVMFGEMGESTMDTMSMIRSMDMVSMSGLMAESTKAIGLTESSTAKAYAQYGATSNVIKTCA